MFTGNFFINIIVNRSDRIESPRVYNQLERNLDRNS